MKTATCISCFGPRDPGSRSGKCWSCAHPPRPDRHCGDCDKKLGRHNRCGYCRSCFWVRLKSSPGFEERRLAGLAVANANPRLQALHAEHLAAFARTPAERARKSELAKQNLHRTVLSPQCRAVAHAPETVAKRTRARVEKMLGWCPPEYRDHYRHLNQKKKVPAATARQMTLDKIARDRSAMTPFERQLDAIRRGAGIVEVTPLRAAGPAYSLTGNGSAACVECAL